MNLRATFLGLWLLAGLAHLPVHAQTVILQDAKDSSSKEAMQWLQRVALAAQKLSYSGTFVYRNGSQSETSRIVHVSSNGNQKEKLEVLDGSPREVIRHNDEITCYLPESRLKIIEQRSTRRIFPALLPVGLSGLGDRYVVRKGSRARIAGFDSQIVRLEPRDEWRYGHQFWIDIETGLLLKAELFDQRGEVLESMAFTELRIGEPANSIEALKSSYAQQSGAQDNWRTRQARMRDLRDDDRWRFAAELPGFYRQAAMSRQILQEGVEEVGEVMHWVYSDGLAALSVFISPLKSEAQALEVGLQSLGAISVMKRVINGHLLVVMGDLPAAAVQHFADGIAEADK
jgi:sigma-E factor negative regulatory protein RseB